MQKSIIKYMISDFKTSILIFFLVIISVTVFVGVVSFTADNISFNGIGLAAMIFLFVAALSSLPTGIRYMNQSGFSRKTAYVNYVASYAILSLFISLLIQIMLLIVNAVSIDNWVITSEYNMLYGGTASNSFFLSVVWFFLATFLFSSLGFFISMLYQKMEKNVKISVSFGVPIFFMILFPIIDTALFNGVVYRAILKAFMFICGFYNGNAYPLLAIGMFLALSVVLYLITYCLLVRKLNFK